MLKILIAQINTCVGDLEGNKKKIVDTIKSAREKGARIVVFPELATTGYPPKDLLLKNRFIQRNIEVVQEIIPETKGLTAIVGFVDQINNKLCNAAAIIHNGKPLGVQHKIHLPNYDVFDEKRYFTPGKKSLLWNIDGLIVGVNICEDIWVPHSPIEIQSAQGAQLIINISASPFHLGKTKERRDLISGKSKNSRVPIIYCNLIGGQDDLVFDGQSYVFNAEGKVIKAGAHFAEDFILVSDFSGKELRFTENISREALQAITLGIHDYVRKNSFEKVVIGLSGGIDSALTAVLAAEALGPENVVGVMMPGPFSSRSSVEDAQELSNNLGITTSTIPISDVYRQYLDTLTPFFAGKEKDLTEENIQARIRGNILMALSNKFNYLVLTTGNKSELAVGYCTLYGDMAGGFGAISDLPKTLVYKIAEYYNTIKGQEIIPRNIFTKAPSAELKPDQTDQDTLPPYEILDEILHQYIEENLPREVIIDKGFEEKTVSDVIRMIDHSEYKRKQAPPGIKLTPIAFGSGRRMPITNKFAG